MTAPSGPILVTGAAGFIGSHLAEALLARGERVVGLDNFDPFYPRALKQRNLDATRAHAHAARYEFVEADLRDQGAMDALFGRVKPAGVIHLAARAGVRPSIEDPAGYASFNVVGTSVLLECARKASCSRFVMASSSSVYGNGARVPFSEEFEVGEPISPYAATKRACELIGYTHHHLTGMPTACLRFFTVYGPRQRPDLAIRKFIGLIASGGTVPVFGDGTTSRDYTFIADIVTGVVSSYDRIAGFGYRVWNLGNSEPVRLSEMIAAIERVVGRRAVIDRRPPQPGDVERTWADTARSSRELGYKPGTAFADGVALQYQWMRREGLAP
ncbi:MAG: GDP-mannose 4,6-dehydratase [Phycisphaerae bacterium]|nr:GDP-mannose 4,6-dehydratase [Phycisphaerae bacterium]